MFLETLDNLMQTHGLNKNSFSKQSGIAYTTIDGFYKKGYENAKLSTLRQIATFFHVSLDYLISGEEKIIELEDSNEYKLLTTYRKLNTFGKNAALERITDLTYNPKYLPNESSKQYKYPSYEIAAYDIDDTPMDEWQPPKKETTAD